MALWLIGLEKYKALGFSAINNQSFKTEIIQNQSIFMFYFIIAILR